jgi:hypothetical protein
MAIIVIIHHHYGTPAPASMTLIRTFYFQDAPVKILESGLGVSPIVLVIIWLMENSWKGDRQCLIALACVCVPLRLNCISCNTRRSAPPPSLTYRLDVKALDKYITLLYSLIR